MTVREAHPDNPGLSAHLKIFNKPTCNDFLHNIHRFQRLGHGNLLGTIFHPTMPTSLPYLLVESWNHFPGKILAFKPYSQGLLLGKPKPRHIP